MGAGHCAGGWCVSEGRGPLGQALAANAAGCLWEVQKLLHWFVTKREKGLALGVVFLLCCAAHKHVLSQDLPP